MVESTTNYEIFVFRNDNREKLNEDHIRRIQASIEMKNLLHIRPITVNSKMEVLDGQHRLLAAKKLGVPIFYEIKPELDLSDIIILNTNKQWNLNDFQNFFVKNGYVEYCKLQEFINKNTLPVSVASYLTGVSTHSQISAYKRGEYIFDIENCHEYLQTCQEILDYIIRMNGKNSYQQSIKFWRALITLVSHVSFDKDKWMNNLRKMIDKIGPRVNMKQYLAVFMDIYNWRNSQRINLLSDSELVY